MLIRVLAKVAAHAQSSIFEGTKHNIQPIQLTFTDPKITCLVIKLGKPAHNFFQPNSSSSLAITPSVPTKPSDLYTSGSATALILAASIGVNPSDAITEAIAPAMRAMSLVCAVANGDERRSERIFLKKE
jgi:hypothetical protein